MSVYREQAAWAWVVETGRGNTLFGWLKPGERFTLGPAVDAEFRDVVCECLGRGWYKLPSGRKGRLGMYCGVFKVQGAQNDKA